MSALKGIKVVEMAAIGPVPLAGMLLADMGADVVVIDKADNPFRFPNDVMHRGKQILQLDVKTENQLAQIKSLIDQADVILEGFRPGVMERLGLGADDCLQRNPKLVFGRMTGWGQSGPLAHSAGHDINYIAITGALHAIGRRNENPVPPLNLVGDYGGGTMFLLMGVLAALLERQQSGKGQVIDAAITEGTLNLMSIIHTMAPLGLWSNTRGSNMLDSGAHYYDSYETADHKYISIGAIEPHFYALLSEKMQLPEDVFAEQNNPAKWPKMKTALADIVKTKTRAQWDEILAGSDACYAPVLTPQEAAEHPQLKERKAFIETDSGLQAAPAPRFSRTPSKVTEKCLKSVDEILLDWS